MAAFVLQWFHKLEKKTTIAKRKWTISCKCLRRDDRAQQRSATQMEMTVQPSTVHVNSEASQGSNNIVEQGQQQEV